MKDVLITLVASPIENVLFTLMAIPFTAEAGERHVVTLDTPLDHRTQ